MWTVILCLVALLVILISHWINSWRNPNCDGRLPPGSMGLPIIGETLQFLSPYTLFDIPPFFKDRMTKYGPLFRTSLFGWPAVVSLDPEVNRYIFQQEDNVFHCWYTDSFVKILGRQSLLAFHGFIHKYLRNLALSLFSPENLRTTVLREMDISTRNYLLPWGTHASVDVKEASSDMIFQFVAKRLFSYDESKALNNLRANFQTFIEGLISFPLNIPGTTYHACLQGRERVIKVIKDTLEERKASKTPGHDFLDYLLEETKKEDTILTEAIAIDLLFVLLFASFETSSSALTMLLKFVTDNPSVLAELTKEHEAILRSRENEKTEISWGEYKSMTFTHMVINETIRLANIAPVVFRKVVKDVEIKGYKIPAGWMMMVCPTALHLNPAKYEDPLAFNPWRWEGQELHVVSKNFMAFGGGVRLCVGADFAKLQMAVFLHYMVTKYRWTIIKGGEISRKPGLTFPNGLHIQISEKHGG